MENVVFTYDGADSATATITGAQIGHQYYFLAANSSFAIDTAVSSTLILTITDIDSSAFGAIPILFYVSDNTSVNNMIACDVFFKGSTDEYRFAQLWDYDTFTHDVSVTFQSEIGVNYQMWISDWGPGYDDASVTGDGTQKTLTASTFTAGMAGDFIGVLQTGTFPVNTSYATRFFHFGFPCPATGYPGNPTPTTPTNDDFEHPTILDNTAGTHNLTGLTTRDAMFQAGEEFLTGGTYPITPQTVWFELNVVADGFYTWTPDNLVDDGNICSYDQLYHAWGKNISVIGDFTDANTRERTIVKGFPNVPRSIVVMAGETWTFTVIAFQDAQPGAQFNDQTYGFDFEATFQPYPWQPIDEGSNVLYAALATGYIDASDLYTIDLATGAETSLGPLGEAVTGLAIHPTTGDMYGVTGNGSTNSGHLLRIDDYLTGPVSVVDIGSLGIGEPGYGTVGDIAFRSDGVLFGWSGSEYALYTINLTTGVASLVGTSPTTGGGAAIDFDGATLYGLINYDTGDICTLNTTTGAQSSVASLSGAPMAVGVSPFAAAAFSPIEGKLYAVDNNYGDGTALVTVDTSTGVVDTVGILFDVGVDAICWLSQSVSTLAVTDITTTTATFHASVNPEGVNSQVLFEYGLTTGYGSTTASQGIGAGSSPVPVAQPVSGLSPGTTYHVRVVRDTGPVNGNDIQFTTAYPAPDATATFSYDGTDPGTVTVRVYGAVIGHSYSATASDPNSTPDSAVAAAENFILTITNVGGMLLPLQFDVVVTDTTSGQTVASTIFTQSAVPEYPNEAGWSYDGSLTVSSTFVSEVGKFYEVSVADDTKSLSGTPVAGTGALMTINLNYSSIGGFEGAFTATLSYQQTVTF